MERQKQSRRNVQKKAQRKSVREGFRPDSLIQLCVLMVIIFCMWKRFAVVDQIGMQGSAYFFSVYDFMICVLVLFPVTIRQIVHKLVQNRFSMMQHKNAFRVMYTAIIMAVLYSIVVIALLYGFSGIIANNLLLGKGGELALYLMIPGVLFLAVSNVVRGFFEGVNSKTPSIFSVFLEQLSMLLGVFIFSRIFISYGEKVAAVLQNPENLYAYGAAGAALGYLVGAFVGFLVSFAIYVLNKKQIRRKNRRDETRKNEDVYDLFVILTKHLLPVALTLFLLQGYQMIDQWIFFKFQDSLQEELMLSYQFGAYSGVYRSVLLCPLLFIFAYQIVDTHALEMGMRSGDFHEVRFKAFSMLKTAMIISFGFAAFALVMARPMVGGLFGLESDLAVRMIRYGAVGIVFMGFAVSSVLIMLGMGKNHMALMNGLISMFIHVLLVFSLVNRTGLGIYGVLISFLVYGITSALLNYIALIRELRSNLDMAKTFLMPFISAAISGVIALVCNLIFGLFMPDLLNLIIVFLIFVLLYFFCLIRSNCINAYTVENSKFGFIFTPLGRFLHIIH